MPVYIDDGPILRMTPTQVESFWSRVRRDDGCWIWTGAQRPIENSLDPTPYGVFHLGGTTWRYAHRIAFLLDRGFIEEGLQVDHLCRQHLCVNPTHLEAVTPRVNAHRGEGMIGKNARKTHCRLGHSLLDPSNVWIENAKNGSVHRKCVMCMRARSESMRDAYRASERQPKPPRDVLEAEYEELSATKLAVKYGVSDVAIRKWLIGYGITLKRSAPKA